MGIAELRSQVGAKLRHRVPATLAARQLFVGCLLVFVGCCYWGILDTFFVQDDFFILSAVRRAMPNMHMLRGTYFFRPLSTYWIPLLNATLWGFAPIPHHATYLALFLATVALLYDWLYGCTRSLAASLAGTVAYAFSKTHDHTLAWIAGGTDVSAAFFFVLSLWAVSRYLRASDRLAGRGASKLPWLAGVAFGCALLSKESCLALAPACLAWMLHRKLNRGSAFQPAEWRLAAVLLAIVVVYLAMWRICVGAIPESRLHFNPQRGLTVLQDSVIAIIPLREAAAPQGTWWLLLPLAVGGMAAAKRQRLADFGESLGLAVALWVLPALIFVFTSYPWDLQFYYAQFSVIGLALLVALATTPRIAPAGHLSWRLARAGAAVGLLAGWVGLAGWTTRSEIERHASPPLRGRAVEGRLPRDPRPPSGQRVPHHRGSRPFGWHVVRDGLRRNDPRDFSERQGAVRSPRQGPQRSAKRGDDSRRQSRRRKRHCRRRRRRVRQHVRTHSRPHHQFRGSRRYGPPADNYLERRRHGGRRLHLHFTR